MSNVLVTGSDGQLGSEIKEFVTNSEFNNDNHLFYFTEMKQLDITNHEQVKNYIKENNIKIIINCAAYTAVDKAESEKQQTERVNHLAVKNLGGLSKEFGIKLIHISTDYIFDGKNFKPYKESDMPNPESVYGETKLAGEKALIEYNLNNSVIIRTSWVYSFYGSNFVKTMLRLGRERDSLNVVFDQIGSPTYAKDLAKAVLLMLPNIKNSDLKIYHYSNEGIASWYDFAKEIMKMAELECKINPIETKDYPTPAKRPHYSVLNKTKIKNDFGIEIPYWKDGLHDCLKRMGEVK
jgi:dTDP-4-dehydrorhamnose reductase